MKPPQSRNGMKNITDKRRQTASFWDQGRSIFPTHHWDEGKKKTNEGSGHRPHKTCP
jgi:hypothetical protein